MLNADIEKQLSQLQSPYDATVHGRALAMLTVLFSKCGDDHSQLSAVAGAVPAICKCVDAEDELVQVIALAVCVPYVACARNVPA